ncbi:integral membrane protein-like protein [Ampelomyces quisqualis]|uniref:Integral membrane protein-like protein n=1 Tax=Ampelomyces quisqualis TaxID=50730 RepID=A0A6A5QEV0_AMPQU|nr:integral membrane protein-like protein [Ampelomyces quisqualis]
MGKVGRFACILTPMLLTLASLICIVIVMVGQVSMKDNNPPTTALGRDLYFFKADTSAFRADPDNVLDNLPEELNVDNNLLEALKGAASSKELKDFYQVGLWSYCEGDKDEKTGVETITYCSKSKSNFWFDPFSVWELKDTSAQKVLGEDLQKGLNTYKKVAGWMVWAFGIALLLSAAEFIIGFFAIFSRWGSLVTTIVSTAQTLFVIAAAATATAVYAVLTGAFESVLKPYNIKATMGRQMLSVVWLAVAFGLASGLFWLLSTCCCSGRSAHKKVSVEKTPYTYERVASPAFPAQHGQHTASVGAGHGQSGTAYEPFRQSRV